MRIIKVKFFFVLLISVAVFSSSSFTIIAHADDDENEIENEQDNAQPVVQSVTAPQTAKVSKPKTVTQTIVDPPTTVVTYQAKTVEYSDSDRDGLIDIEDPHPDIPEIYFVKDDNFNGIVDTFENYVAQ